MSSLNFAEIESAKEIFAAFMCHKEWFPHIRYDYIKRQISARNVVYDSEKIIIFNYYKRKQKLGDIHANKNDVILHQILNSSSDRNSPNYVRTEDIFDRFFNMVKTNVFLTVREENIKAISFYKKVGFEEVSKISWKKGSMPGLVFVKKTNV